MQVSILLDLREKLGQRTTMEQLAQAAPTQNTTPCTIVDQKRLFDLYQSVPDADAYAEMLGMEQEWIIPLSRKFEKEAPPFDSCTELLPAMREFLVDEGKTESANHRFLAWDSSYEQFKHVVREFAVDGLTESLSLLAVVPRLPYRSGMAVFRILIDELGCGNEAQTHSQLYLLFHWLANRTPAPECSGSRRVSKSAV